MEYSIFWAGIAQLVEYKLPKLGVASSNLVARSKDVRFFVCLGCLGRVFIYVYVVCSYFFLMVVFMKK